MTVACARRDDRHRRILHRRSRRCDADRSPRLFRRVRAGLRHLCQCRQERDARRALLADRAPRRGERGRRARHGGRRAHPFAAQGSPSPSPASPGLTAARPRSRSGSCISRPARRDASDQPREGAVRRSRARRDQAAERRARALCCSAHCCEASARVVRVHRPHRHGPRRHGYISARPCRRAPQPAARTAASGSCRRCRRRPRTPFGEWVEMPAVFEMREGPVEIFDEDRARCVGRARPCVVKLSRMSL